MNPVRFSHLKAFAKSPAHGKHATSGGEIDPTCAMERGTAVHALVMNTRKVVFYGKARNEEHKDYQKFMADNPNAEILTAKEYDKANRMADAIRANPMAMEILVGPDIINERTVLWDLAGRPCRGTPDAVGFDLVDLKCTGDASPEEFYWHVKRMHYHVQLAWYSLGLDLNGESVEGQRKLVVVEDKPPHVVQVYRIGPRMSEAGDKLARIWFETLINCERNGEFPGYSQAELELEEQSDDLVFADAA
jgi:hypothetical protein